MPPFLIAMQYLKHHACSFICRLLILHMKTLLEDLLVQTDTLSDVFTHSLSIAYEVVKCTKWYGVRREVLAFTYIKKKRYPSMACCNEASISHWRWALQTSALYAIFPSFPYAEKHTLNFHTAELKLPAYLSLEFYAEKVINIQLDYNSVNTSYSDRNISVFLNFEKAS